MENDVATAGMTKAILLANDHEVFGIAAASNDAMILALFGAPDIALIDLELDDDERGTDVGARLPTLSGIGIIYTTGNVGAERFVRAVGEGRLIKLHSCDDLLRAVEIASEIVATGTTRRPYPETFRRLGKTREPSRD